jgi:hypothetical protein
MSRSFGLTPQVKDAALSNVTISQIARVNNLAYNRLIPEIIIPDPTPAPTQVYLMVSQSIAQPIPNSTQTAVSFDQVTFNIGGFVLSSVGDITNAEITIPLTGIYTISYTVPFESASAGGRYGYVVWNLSELSLGASTTPGIDSFIVVVSGTCSLPLVAGNTIRVQIYQNAGASLNLSTGSQCSQLTIVKVSDLSEI